MHCIGVDEGDLEPEQAGPGCGIDQLDPLAFERGKLGCDIVDFVGDVVHAWTTLGKETSDGRVLAEGGEEFDSPRAQAERGCLDTLIGDRRPLLQTRAEETLVRGERFVQIVDGETQVVDRAGSHADDASD